jgi:hypothetical protein
MRRVATIFCFVALVAVAYGGFNLWRTAEQLNQVSANFAGRSSARQPDPTEERASVPLDGEPLPPDVDVPQRAAFEDAGFAESLATAAEFDATNEEPPIDEAYPEPGFDEAYADSGFDEPYVEPELEADYAEHAGAEPVADEIFDGSDPSAALQELLSDPDPAVREEAAALLEALQSQELVEDPQ